MDYVAMLDVAGLVVVTGHRRLTVALDAGQKVLAQDAEGRVYELSIQGEVFSISERSDLQPAPSMLLVSREPKNQNLWLNLHELDSSPISQESKAPNTVASEDLQFPDPAKASPGKVTIH